MKILRVANIMFSRGYGGIEQAAVDYSEAVTLAGHESYAVIHPEAVIRGMLSERNLPFYCLTNHGAWDVLAILKLRRILDALSIDVCIAHGNRALSLLKYAGGKRKVVAVMHNYKIHCDGTHAVFCPTQDLIRHTLAQGARQEDIRHIPNMVRVTRGFTQRKPGVPPVIGGMGRFVAKKGFDVFIESLAILKSRHIPFRAILGGGGEEEAQLKILATGKSLGDVLSFSGWVENKTEFLGGLDIFCLPSHHEPFGIVLLEAMTAGIPSVSTDSEGPSEIIAHGEDGLLVAKGDATALADGLQALLINPDKADLLAKNGYNTVKLSYDLPVVSRKLAFALDSL